MMKSIRTLRRDERGSVALEAWAVLSLLLILLLGSVQSSLAYFAWNTMLLAAEEAGRYAMLFHNYPGTILSGPNANNPPGCADTFANCAVAWANQNFGNIFPVTPDIADPNCPSGMSFTATYTINLVTPIALSRYVCIPPLT